MRFPNRFFQICVALMLFMAIGGTMTTLRAEKKPQMSRIYMYGFAGSFTDSIAYLTEICQVDTAWLNQHKMLIDRTLYSQQLQFYVEALGINHPICSVEFNKSAKSLKKVWQKVKKRYQKATGLKFKIIPLSEFKFKSEEYRAIYMDDLVSPVQNDAQKKKK